jgi:hypothetical protein
MSEKKEKQIVKTDKDEQVLQKPIETIEMGTKNKKRGGGKMINKLKKIGETRYQIEFSDEDILQGKNKIDLGEEGDFIAEYAIVEVNEDGRLLPNIEIFGTYIKESMKDSSLSLFVTLDLRAPITLKDIQKGEWTIGEILSSPWIDWAVF